MISAITRALAAKRDATKTGKEEGFTLIELLVVVLIIGILAAIAIPVFLGQQNQAKDAAAKSDLGNLKIAEISYAAANNGTLTVSTSALSNYGFVGTSGVTNLGVSLGAAAGTFCVGDKSAAGNWWAATDSLGVQSGQCTAGAITAAP